MGAEEKKEACLLRSSVQQAGFKEDGHGVWCSSLLKHDYEGMGHRA